MIINGERRKLIIQIPCYNEEASLPVTLKALPAAIIGYDSLEILVIDDGSTDGTVKVARAHGVQHIVSHHHNRGLSAAFMTGLETSLALGAHTIVNCDADNQYCADDIQTIVNPIIQSGAFVVIGTRPISTIQRFTAAKKFFQYFGSWVVRIISQTNVPDAPSGFRAIHRDVAGQINIYSRYTYTIEMIIQLGSKNIPITCVPIHVNDHDLRPSRLVQSTPGYIFKSAWTIFRMFVLYRPILFFLCISFVLFLGCTSLSLRYLYFMLTGYGGGHVQSLLLAVILAISSVIAFLIGLVCDGIKINRMAIEDVRYRLIRTQERA